MAWRKREKKKEKKTAWIVRLAWRYGWKPGRVMREVLEWIEVLVVAGALAALIMTFITVRMTVPSGSMLPTIELGDSFFVDRVTYYFRDPKPGDIVVFRHTDKVLVRRVADGSLADQAELPAGKQIVSLVGIPEGEEFRAEYQFPVYSTEWIDAQLATWDDGTRLVLITADLEQYYFGAKTASIDSLEDLGIITRDRRIRYVKRLVAVGGQTIQILDGDLYVDGQELTAPEFDRTYLSDDLGYRYGVEPTLVPEGHYFVLGDNSANSLDSRYWGFVASRDFIGEPYLRVWPLSRFGWMNR